MSKRPITIATAQSRISADVRENGKEIRSLMRQARERGATLAHFPEAALSGYTKSQIRDWDRVDWDALLCEQRLVAECAHQLSLWVVMGCNHRLTPPYRPHNSLYIIAADGGFSHAMTSGSAPIQRSRGSTALAGETAFSKLKDGGSVARCALKFSSPNCFCVTRNWM